MVQLLLELRLRVLLDCCTSGLPCTRPARRLRDAHAYKRCVPPDVASKPALRIHRHILCMEGAYILQSLPWQRRHGPLLSDLVAAPTQRHAHAQASRLDRSGRSTPPAPRIQHSSLPRLWTKRSASCRVWRAVVAAPQHHPIACRKIACAKSQRISTNQREDLQECILSESAFVSKPTRLCNFGGFL